MASRPYYDTETYDSALLNDGMRCRSVKTLEGITRLWLLDR